MSSALWELEGLGWREGRHGGTLVSERGLELIPGVSRGTWETTLPDRGPFTHLVASLNPDPWPVGSGLRLTVRLRSEAGWSPWCSLGTYGESEDLPRSEPSPQGAPSSQSAPSSQAAPRVLGDLLRSQRPAFEVGLRLEIEAGSLGGSPLLRRLALCGWDAQTSARSDDADLEDAWGRTLDVGPRSQRTLDASLSDRACSPTSLASVLAFWGHDLPTEQVAAAVHDRGADLYGNWSFNVAFAAEHALRSTVRRLDGLRDLEAEILAGRPVVISHRYEEGDLQGAPLSKTDGHLVVVVGFTKDGDVVVNDPAADPAKGEEVRRVYRRAEVARTWLANADGIAYVIAPDIADLSAITAKNPA